MLDTPIGKVIKSYEVEGLIGTGGFGAVYRARQAVVEREVAIKIIWPAFASHPNFIRRFEAEAQLVAGLEHPYIVPLYDYWRDPDGAYIVMRYLRGGHLRSRLTGEPWALRDIQRFLTQVAAALALAHRYGVVHRDIKPENILLDEDDNAYLADFGIAQILSSATAADEMDGLGSPAYAAPEQIKGGSTSTQSDIYSLGLILYELLTGRHPFPQLEHLSLTEMNRLRISTPLPPLREARPDLPPALDEIIQRATALDYRQRYPDALTLAASFQTASGQGLRSASLRTTTGAAAATLPNPYKGLRAFQESDARDFFGREALVSRLLNRLREPGDYRRFLAVVGPSGSGKSSLVKAGLLPALRQGALPGSEHWFYREFAPGAQPFEELAGALLSVAATPPDDLTALLRRDAGALLRVLPAILPPDDSELFLFIDQFEEIFTLVPDEADMQHFLRLLFQALTAPAARLRVVITIRADFYDRPLLQPHLSDLVRERTEVVVPLSGPELQRAIIEPARNVGISLDSGLVAAMVAEIQGQPAALPLLQYALSELFDRREGDMMTPTAYQELGGVRGSLARRAEELYNSLPEPQREAVRQLFLRLITLGEGTEDTRRRALLAEVTSLRDHDERTDDRAIMRQVVERLGKARLLTFDRDPVTRSPTLEITHEAIIREWLRLRHWLDDSRGDVRMQRTLAALVSDWEAAGRDTGLLMRGIRLVNYEKWAQTTALALTEQEAAFLQISVEERRRQEMAEQARQQRERDLERRSLGRLRLLALVLLLAVGGALGLSGFAFTERNRAEVALATSDASARISQSLALEASARRALSDGDSDLALVLALQANAPADAPAQSGRTLAEVAFAPGTRAVLSGHTSRVNAVALSPDGRTLASASSDATVRLWHMADGTLLQTLRGHRGDVETVAFSPDGRYVASGAVDFETVIHDTTTGAEVMRFRGHTLPVRSLAFSPDGTRLLTGSSDTLLILWDVATGAQVQRFGGHRVVVTSVAFAPDGRTVLSGARDGALILWEVATGAPRWQVAAHPTGITDVAYTPDGQQVVSSSGDGTLLFWSLDAGRQGQRLYSPGVEIRSIAFTPDGRELYAAAMDGHLHRWNVVTGLEEGFLAGHAGGVNSLAISPDGRQLVSASLDKTVRLWNIGSPAQRQRLTGHRNRVTALEYSADGRTLYSTDNDGTLWAWPADGSAGRLITDQNVPLLALALLPAGDAALIGGRAGRLLLVDLAGGTFQREFRGSSEAIEALALSPDGTAFASGSEDGGLLLWNLATGNLQQRFAGHTGAIYEVAFDPQGRWLASAGRDDRARVWEVATGALRYELSGHAGPVYSVAFSPDGTRIATGSQDGFVIVWDAATGTEQTRLFSDTRSVWQVGYSADGGRLLAGSADGVLVIRDAPAYNEWQRFESPAESIYAARFSPDGRTAAVGMEDGTVILWQTLPRAELIAWARANRYVRPITCFERDQYRLELPCQRGPAATAEPSA
ncbi:MAG: protein kinase [Anaerolineae bacterium]|nr:protein kinase [Anaerolineae bacterium]